MWSFLKMREADIAWIAGIVEGEGTFCIAGPNGRRTYPQIIVEMSDKDVVEKLAAFWTSTVRCRPRAPFKDLYKATLSGKNAAIWMLRLYPLLGARRRGRVREILKAYGTREIRKPGPKPHVELPKEG